MKYKDMYSLFTAEPAAKHYFDTLPGYVKEQISLRAENVNSFDSLKDYAQNLTRGDG